MWRLNMTKSGNLHGWSKEASIRYLIKLVLLGFLIGFVVATVGHGNWTALFMWDPFSIVIPFGVWFIIPACVLGIYVLFR